MQVDNINIKQSSIGNLADTTKPLHASVIDFLEENISVFIEQYIDGKVEKGLNSNFVLCMNNQIQNELFIFGHEDPEIKSSGNSPSIDISVYPRSKGTRRKRFFAFEAKRLNNELDYRRKKEYVFGNGGGIERFKRDIHAQELSYAAMIGYVQSDSFSIWESRVNSWIDEKITSLDLCDLTWEHNDKLIKKNETLEIAKFSSTHIRLSNKEIKLIHIWINLLK